MPLGKLDLVEEEYIAESGDHTPEASRPVDNGDAVVENTNGHSNGELRVRKNEPRVPDMQLGKCRYVRLHDNVNYVAAAIILRNQGDDTEVLLIQEAKKSCRGKWYMPAGRVEAGETIEESVVREVKEETGYNCCVIELLSLQVQGSGWYRYAFFCEITGGDLKTQPDQESLAAEWYNIKDVKANKVQLRGRDFIRLIDEAVTYRSHGPVESIPRVLPISQNVAGLFLEFMIVKHSRDGLRTEVLVHKSIKDETYLLEEEQPFPTVEFGFEYFFAMVVSKCYRHLLEEGANVVFTPSHVTRIKCHPKPMESLAHGVSVRVYCQHKQSATKAIIRSPRYHWITVDSLETRKRFHMEQKQFRPSLHML
ncbi:CRE-NDX-1 protein [Caenorhabditis remanei]|uniref:CRE-NDX-1 protein n=1 Tax=Caenorhabditis remanei TaxID=31234 RepID=E3N1I6_CAERE|nr:CRE-NDX-1 protein [Caenorhabditis remanei]